MTERTKERHGRRLSAEDRLTLAMDRISKDLDDNFDPTVGFSIYPANRGRISIAEVLRRADRMDKNTLKQPQHAAIRGTVQRFVKDVQSRILGHKREAKVASKNNALNKQLNADLLESFAQKFKAAEYRADAAEQLARDLEIKCENLAAELATAAEMIAELRAELSEGRIVKLRPDQ